MQPEGSSRISFVWLSGASCPILVLTTGMKSDGITTGEQTGKTSWLPNERARKSDFFTVIVLLLVMSQPCHADESQAMTNDLVSFFKQAISSPRDVDNFTGRCHSFAKPRSGAISLEYYQGARAGSNFFIGFLYKCASDVKRRDPMPFPLQAGQVRVHMNLVPIQFPAALGLARCKPISGSFTERHPGFLTWGLSYMIPKALSGKAIISRPQPQMNGYEANLWFQMICPAN